MNLSSLLERCLSRIKKGDLKFRQVLLPIISEAELVVPLNSSETIKPLTKKLEDRTIIFAYSSVENLKTSEFSTQDFAVVQGIELAAGLSGKTFLYLDAGFNNEIELTPSDLRAIKKNQYTCKEAVQVTDSLISRSEKKTIVAEELSEVLQKYPGVVEAYFEETLDPNIPVIVGFLGNRISDKERFQLVEEISVVSLLFYGEPGAIEVFDDLDKHNWELFKTLVPFFERGELEEEEQISNL